MMALFASLRLEGLTGPWSWMWMAVVVAGAGFLTWTYHGIWKRSGRSLAWGLFALRAVGLLCLALMLARPTWTQARDEVERNRVAIVVDTSRSMSLADSSGATRFARARLAAENLRRKLRDSRLEVDYFDIAGAPLAELPKAPTAEFTDLTRGLRRTLAQMRSQPLAGVVLISDGVDTTGRQTFADWEATRVPIHAVGFPRALELDLAVRDPSAPRKVLVHNEVKVEVPISKKGQAALDATVSLKRGGEVLASRKISLPAGDSEQVVALSYRPDQPGSFELTCVIESEAGEKDTGNNGVNFPVEVIKDPIRVLYIEGFLRNEYTFLVRHFAEKDPDVTLIKEPRRTGNDGPEQRLAQGIFDEKTLEKVDVVILGDMEGEYLTAAQYQTLVKWLDGKNHSLLVLGGYESFGVKGFRATPLADVLPVVFAASATQSEKPFTLTLTDKGLAHPISTLNSDKVRSEKMWKEAPPLDGMPLVARAKPGADVLATNSDVQQEGQPAVALAVQRAGGGGHVMVFCPDTTWKWSRLPRLVGQDDTLYSRFWSQTIRWLAGRSLEDSRPLLSLRTERPIHEIKRKVIVRVVQQRRPGTDLTGAQLSVDITDPKGQGVPGLTPRQDPTDPDLATVEFFPALAGKYTLAAALKADGKVLANQASEVLVRGNELELTDTGTRPDHLRAIQSATGGEYADIDDAESLAAAIPRGERRQVREKRTEFWDSPMLFGAFVLAVSGEWLLRRRNHLV